MSAGFSRGFAAELTALASAFPRVRRVHSRDLPEAARRHPEIAALGAGTYLLAALSCHRREPDDLSTPGDPHALVAPFARRNYYREAVHRLKQVSLRLGANAPALPRARLRIFSNSPLPEKLLAAAAGLGFLGANSLVIAPGLGSAFVVAGIFVPAELGSDPPLDGGLEPGAGCGTCRACRDACPVGAIPAPGRLDASRCLQALATVLDPWPTGAREAWGFRLYGCQACQDACPFNRDLTVETATERGAVGPSLPLARLLACTPAELKELLRGTALDMSWIPGEALLRNALLVAGRRADREVLPRVQRHLQSTHPAVRAEAALAEEALRRG